MQGRIEHDIAAAHGVLADLRPAQHERAPLPRLALLDRPVLGVDRAHARLQARWADEDVVIDAHRAGQDRPGHRRAEAGKRKRAVDRQAEATVLRPQRGYGCRGIEAGRQTSGRPSPVTAETENDLRALEARARQHRLDIAPSLQRAGPRRRDRTC